MHVGMFCHNYPPHPGGLEVMVRMLGAGLARRGHRVTVVTSAWPAVPQGVAGRAEEDGMTVHRLSAVHASEGWGVPWPLPTGGGVAAAVAETRGADVFHAHGALYATSLLAARLSHGADRPLVLTEHVGFVGYSSPLVNAVQSAAWATVGNHLIAHTSHLVTYNARVLDWLAERYPGVPLSFVGNGVDSASFRPRTAEERRELRRGLGLPEDEVVALFVGRQSAKKNLEPLLAAPRRGWRLAVCGAAGRTVPAGVIDLGVVPHARMPELYAAADLMVNPSVGEGFPLAVQEAMAAGLPLVLLWDPGYAGWLDRGVPAACDTFAELLSNVDRLAADPAARAALATRERAWVEERWSWEATAAAYEALYEDAL